ncbi:MAG: NADP oxidoreductase, partial [Actinobacteria bacterium]|nr:NADP oxidoreductase [Actinomycetota bacterium]
DRCPDHITYTHWQAIDDAERTAGEPHGRPRVKLVRKEHLLDAAKNAEPARD